MRYTDFLGAMIPTVIEPHDALITAAFHRLSMDNTGFITTQSLQHILGDDVDAATVKNMLNEADYDLDGKISLEKFTHFVKNGPEETLGIDEQAQAKLQKGASKPKGNKMKHVGSSVFMKEPPKKSTTTCCFG